MFSQRDNDSDQLLHKPAPRLKHFRAELSCPYNTRLFIALENR